MNTQEQINKLIEANRLISEALSNDGVLYVNKSFTKPYLDVQIDNSIFGKFSKGKETLILGRGGGTFPYEAYFIENGVRFYAVMSVDDYKKMNSLQ
ncbi:hypothetical protein [Virgibacillus pantothenticus]|uniref:Uncharacterized protein n=1 Tax=Virgibacillus pantothenticus TaxID=1473 RepID=A0A0L0QV95_VIRPA|nr:hypothetical protein [Virgibacillus pantothenticus]KNE22452.1 hypothetical protein AFK71_02190 [Virgibacillus pantothenticus]MED3739380.1 hypothetical protein [Virgibacillus pantothenticus]QTY16911.1 hypothetical protein KBP50_03030 [Virgibacillus pantothenticus]SIS85496.1 hypothetical protein SAMN05421787_1053 [Virgibacillus pantothenticus]